MTNCLVYTTNIIVMPFVPTGPKFNDLYIMVVSGAKKIMFCAK